MAEDYKVIITGQGKLVRFEASVPVSEGRVSNYEGFNIVHLPTSLWAYRNTNGRHFAVTGKLVSRNINEANMNAKYLTTIRGWILSDFGNSGAPPPIVFLTAYNNKNLTKVPCIILSYNWLFPDEVDYIYGGDEPMPVIGIITIELEEAYSAAQITSGAWKITSSETTGPVQNAGFSYVGTPGTASRGGAGAIETKPSYGPGFIGLAAGSSGFPSLGGLLTLSPGIIAKLPTMAGSVIGAATNSPLLSTVAQEAVGLLNNQFVSGSSIQGVLNNSTTVSPPTNTANSKAPDSFGRVTNLSIPTPGDYI